MSWVRTSSMSTTSPSTSSSGSSAALSLSSLPLDYEIPTVQPSSSSSSSSSSSFFVLHSSNYINEQLAREQDDNNELLLPPPSLYNYNNHHHHSYSQIYPPSFSSRVNSLDSFPRNTNGIHVPHLSSYDVSSSVQSPFLYEQYLTSLKSEQSDHLPYLFDNIIYPQPCSPPSPTNDSITYYQLDQANTTTVINKFPQQSHVQTIQPITYQQLSLVEPPSSNTQQKLPIVKRVHYDSNIPNAATATTIMSNTSMISNVTENDRTNLPYARLDSTCFGTYDIWQERTIIGRKSHRREVDVNMGSTPVVSRIHFELLLVNGTEFRLKCFSKNGIFINHNYAKMSSITVLPKQCTLRFPSTDICILFSSLLNNSNNSNTTNGTLTDSVPQHHISTNMSSPHARCSLSIPINLTAALSFQSVPNIMPEQQVIYVDVNQHTQRMINHELNGTSLPPLTINIPNPLSSSSPSTTGSSLSAGSSTEPMKCHYASPIANNNSFLGSSVSSCSTTPKHETNENQLQMNSPILQRMLPNHSDHFERDNSHGQSKKATKPPFSYAQLIVQAILSTPDKQMTLSQIYNYISSQYPYYETNNRGWQNSIRHNLSLNRYFIRVARKENESGKGSFWRLDHTCEEKLVDHAFQHRKQRTNSTMNISTNFHMKHDPEEISPNTNDQTDFLLADIHTSNSSTPLSLMTSPVTSIISPTRHMEDYKRKRNDNEDDDLILDDVEDLVNSMLDSINPNIKIITPTRIIKRQKT